MTFIELAIAILSALAALASAYIAYTLGEQDVRRAAEEKTRTTFAAMRYHRERLAEADTVYVCMSAFPELPEPMRKRIARLRGSPEPFVCDREWCWMLRRCIGSAESDLADSESASGLDDNQAWAMATTMYEALDSYSFLANQFHLGAVDRRVVREYLEDELYPTSPLVGFIVSLSDFRDMGDEYPCLTRLISELNPGERFPTDWYDACHPST